MKKRSYIGFIAPGFIIYTVFMIVPIACAIYYSFFEWSGIGPMKFVALDNYRKLFLDPRTSRIFFNALTNNIKYVFTVLLVISPLQIFLAYMLYMKIRFFKYIRFMLFLPYVISTSIVGFFAMLIFDPNIGILNEIIGSLFGAQAKLAWLGDPDMVFKIFVVVIIWQCVGQGMLIFFANMQEISTDIIEASRIDGAGNWQRFWRIVLPMSHSSIATNITLSIIYAFTMFDLPYILVGPQGGVNNKLDFLNMFFYRNAFGGSFYGTTSIGFGSSISVILFLIIFTITVVVKRLLKRLEY